MNRTWLQLITRGLVGITPLYKLAGTKDLLTGKTRPTLGDLIKDFRSIHDKPYKRSEWQW